MVRQASKRKQVSEVTSGSDTETPKKQKKSTAFVPFDPSVPTNTTMPDTYDFLAAPPGGVKLASYNVNSLKAAMRKGYSNYVKAENADVLCLQETKVNEPVPDAVDDKVYKYRYWSYEDKKGYAGTALFSKVKPSQVVYGIPGHEASSRGRVITAHFKDFVMVACYIPNAGEGLKNLDSRMVFNTHMEKYLRGLQQDGKRVIWTGSAGFTVEERTDFTKLLTDSEDPKLPAMIDTWRRLHPTTKGHYTYYGYRFNCRSKLLGWRLDYFVITPDLEDRVIESEIRQTAYGASDHVPIVLVLRDTEL
ncbi:hypothetical protein K450DRAFT_174538 [Umbelopsis ramanniana AG]|uniref:Endonuclease/exonuclease/phosphatase domain-containing protein n=1 Tax=Umbelopsis ramanniana AG TaxID=1314678 RepID=A0AAD5EAP2_UMBRA|nr:uncharacterized protein K450DRAFT_174538 [Umbelopsis ramanniana AG]KAI8579837.1 hypothetical protein K450DRAFT_174538 [Umbelopsis ramanniana AG]